MKKILYVGMSNIIRADAGSSESVEWEIDNDDDMVIKLRNDENEVEIIPELSSLKIPQRILKYTIKATGESRQIDILIEKGIKLVPDQEGLPAAFEEPTGEAAGETVISEKKIPHGSISAIPQTFSVAADKRVLMPWSASVPEDVSWTFSNEKLNGCLRLTAEGVYLDSVPAGFHTLYCEFSDGRRSEVVIQSHAGASSDLTPIGGREIPIGPLEGEKNPVQPADPVMPAGPPPASPEQSNEYGDPGEQGKNWPKISGGCAFEVRNGGKILQKYPFRRNAESLLIGKHSTSGKAVDIDLKQYSKNTGISRNHLKIWRSGDFLMMKNIGSHHVKYKGKELVPDQIAVLSIGGEIEIGELTIVVVSDAP